MSIVNQMLQDLDKRKEPTGGVSMTGDAIRTVKTVSPWRRQQTTVAAIVALGLVMLALGLWLRQSRDAEVRQVAVPELLPAPLAPVAVASAPPAPLAAVEAASAPPVPLTPLATMTAASASPAPLAVMAVASAPPTKVAVPIAQVSPATPVAAAASMARVSKPPVLVSAPPVAMPAAPVTTETIEPPADLAKAATPPPKPATAKSYNPKQLAGNLLSEAIALEQQGRLEEAKAPLQRALKANPLDVEARQMLVQLQFDTGQTEEAQSLLDEGRRLIPAQSGFSMASARLKMESGDTQGALSILEGGLSKAGDEPRYHAFLGALLLRAQRHDEAVQHYLVALRSDPANVTWLVGVGAALEAVGKKADATEAYRRAESTGNSTPEQAKFLNDRLGQLGR